VCAAYVFAYAYVIRSTRDAYCDISTSKHWAQITSNFLAVFAEIFSYSVGRPLIFEWQDNSNGLI